ncbi:MAG: S41 family peptidase [Firmicutes bacterium]|nr:S41 family peptidase [Bacillota bacterium]
MSKKISIPAVIILILLAVVVTFQATYLGINNKYARQMNELYANHEYYGKLSSLEALFNTYYIGEIDPELIEEGIMRGYVSGSGDKYANYFTKEQFEELMASQNGDMVGIGVHVVYDADSAALHIVSVLPDSPALEAGVLPGDLIVSVGDNDVAAVGYYKAVELMQGEEGTFAEFTVLRGMTERLDFKVQRAHVTDLSVEGRMFCDENGETTDIGIIRITEFDATTPVQLPEQVEALKLQGAEKIVFDLRNNPGGELTSIVKVLDYLLPEGPIIRTVDKAGNEDVQNSDSSWLDMPLAVIVNGNTASAAELFSSALKDYNSKGKIRATLVGTTTYGKGTMQTVIQLEDGSAVSISYKMYNPPYSDNYEGKGVEPDIRVELSDDAAEMNPYLLPDAMDTQLLAAVECLK